MGNDGLVIADSEPTTAIGKLTWLQILPDGTRKWFERADSGWQLVKTEDAPVAADHSHPELGDINFTGSISADGEAGLTGSRTIDGHTLTFKSGLLVGYEAP